MTRNEWERELRRQYKALRRDQARFSWVNAVQSRGRTRDGDSCSITFSWKHQSTSLDRATFDVWLFVDRTCFLTGLQKQFVSFRDIAEGMVGHRFLRRVERSRDFLHPFFVDIGNDELDPLNRAVSATHVELP